MRKVIHLIPSDGIGGVEVAARTIKDGRYMGFNFQKYYVGHDSRFGTSDSEAARPALSINNPRAYYRAVHYVIEQKPDLVIASLWRSCIVLIAVKLLRPSTKTVTFLHLAKTTNLLDWLLNRLAMSWSMEIWADSSTTLAARVTPALQARGRVISFLIRRPEKLPPARLRPRFVFWGRLHPQKNLARAIKIFRDLHAVFPDAKFSIIGPDNGVCENLKALACKLGISEAVAFLGSMNQAQLSGFARENSFYLQTSNVEGMAMSVVEAMQFGLVPIVTPAGEIKRYCRDGENAVIISKNVDVTARVQDLLTHPERYHSMSQNAIATWNSRPIYRDDILAGCQQLLGFSPSSDHQ